MMLLQYTAAALASENKVLAHPGSADSIPTSANQEDHVSMGAISGRHARMVLEHVERIVALELLAGAQALDLRRDLLAAGAGTAGESPRPGTAVAEPPSPGIGVAEAHRRIRAVVPRLDRDREMGPDIEAATRLVRTGALADLVHA
jgi:histidine ammonia-lyase